MLGVAGVTSVAGKVGEAALEFEADAAEMVDEAGVDVRSLPEVCPPEAINFFLLCLALLSFSFQPLLDSAIGTCSWVMAQPVKKYNVMTRFWEHKMTSTENHFHIMCVIPMSNRHT